MFRLIRGIRIGKKMMELTRSSSRVKFTRHVSMESGPGKDELTVAICQMTAKGEKEVNFKVCSSLIARAKAKGAKMVFLPEAFDFIADNKEQTKEFAEPINGDLIQKYCTLATENKLWLSLGGFHEKDSSGELNRIHNAHIIINDCGQLAAVYRKIHLFDVTLQTGQKLHESDYVIPGTKIVQPVETPIGKIGLGICYDVRFPEFSIALTQMGAEILTYPSAFTVTTGLAHWEILLRSRAIENQCYVIAAAQTGIHNARRESYGHSMVVDPWGAVIAQCHEGTDIVTADIDLAFLHQIRRDMPVSFHRRKELYDVTNFCQPISESDEFRFGSFVLKPEQVFLKTEFSFAFVNYKPVLPGHVLVSPRRSVARTNGLKREELVDLFACVQSVQKVIEEEFETSSSTVTLQDGPDAGQTVPHLHVHVLPRKKGDFQNNDDIYRELEKLDSDVRSPRSDEDMANESRKLRKKFV